MATTAILRSRDCLLRHPNPNFSKPRRRIRRCQTNGRDHLTRLTANRNRTANIPPPLPKSNNKNIVMGDVRILKRGEMLPGLLQNTVAPFGKIGDNNKTTALRDGGDGMDLILCSTGRLGPDPETVQKEIKVWDLYAGVAPFVASPPPSSLPLPAFFTKKEKINNATTDLRRLLKLDLV